MNILYLTDSKIPNNWFIRHSTIMKNQGHNTFLSHDSPDQIFVSCVFKKNVPQFNGLKYVHDADSKHSSGGGAVLRLAGATHSCEF